MNLVTNILKTKKECHLIDSYVIRVTHTAIEMTNICNYRTSRVLMLRHLS